MQTDLSSLSQLDYAFGLAKKEVKDNVIYPALYQGERMDWFNPISKSGINDMVKSFCFFDTEDPQEWHYGERSGYRKHARIKVNLSIIFWFHLKRVQQADYRFVIGKLKEDIMNRVARSFGSADYTPQRTYEHSTEAIFKGYTINQTVPMFPFWAFRVEGELWWREDCYTVNTYS